LIFVFLLAPKPYVSLAQNIKIDKSQWERERRGYDFKKPEKPEKQKKETRETESRDYVPITISPILKWGAIILGIGFLLYLLIKALGLDKSSNFNRQNKGAKKINVVIEDLTKEEFVKTEFELLIEEALSKRDYRLAHRYQFLSTLQILQKNNWIHWGKEKTNHDYLFATSGQVFYSSFRDLVNAFDLVWYGERKIDEKIFYYINKEHLSFNRLIKK